LFSVLKENKFSENRSASFLRWKDVEAFTQLGTVERANLSHCGCYPFAWRRKQIQFLKYCAPSECWTKDSVQNVRYFKIYVLIVKIIIIFIYCLFSF
jgi:hypothetical protein